MPRKFVTLDIEEISSVDRPANKRKYLVIKAAQGELVTRATWTAAFINTLPDESFAHISPGGEKDADGKTTPRSLRHLPYKDASGKPDAAHTRNALARLPLTDIPASAKASARRKLLAAAKELEIDVSEKIHKMYGPMTTDEIQAHEEAMQAWFQLWSYFMRSVDSIMCADEDKEGIDKTAMLREAVDQFATKARELLTTMGGDMEKRATERLEQLVTITKQGRKLSADRMRRLKEAMGLLETIMHEGMEPEEDGMEKTEELTRRVAELETAHAALQAEHATLKAESAVLTGENTALKGDLTKALMTPEEQEAEYLKGLPDVIRREREADKLEKTELRQKLQAAEDRNAKQAYITKAAGYKALPINPDDDWEVFKAIATLDDKSRARIEQLFKSAEELCAEAKVFQAVGTGGSGGSMGGSTAYTQLEVLAVELQKGAKMTKEQAIVKAMDVRPDLAKQHRDERKEARNGG